MMRLPVTEISTRVRTTGSGLLRAAALLLVATADACTVIVGKAHRPRLCPRTRASIDSDIDIETIEEGVYR